MSHPDDTVVALGLGVVQGLTEFLPVSSDGHLATYSLLFGLSDASLTLTVLLHVGTLLATVIVFWPDLWRLLQSTLGGLRQPRTLLASSDGELLRNIVVASVPTAVIGLFLEHRVEALSQIRWVVGAGFLGSAIAVLSTRGKIEGRDSITPGAAFILGAFQGLAVLPGLSRSAVTIATAIAFGMSAPAAFRFSFLLSVPAVAGAAVLELAHPGALSSLGSTAYLAAFLSFVTGYAALRMLRAVLGRGHFWLFGLYLVPLGIAMVLWDVFRG